MRWFMRVVAIAALALFCAGLVLQNRLPGWREKFRQSPQNSHLAEVEATGEKAASGVPSASGEPMVNGEPAVADDEPLPTPVSAETGLPLPELANLGADADAQFVAAPEGRSAEAAPVDDDAAPPARTPLGKAFRQLVDQTSEYLGEAQQEANESIDRADRVLADAKSRNSDALRQANRQVRRLGTSDNLLLIVVEDLACDDLGCYGQSLIATPNIDSLAEDGARLTRCLAWTQGAAANRWALLCGDVPNDQSGKYLARPSHATLPEMLWQSGYTTVLVGDCSWAGVRDSYAGGWDHWWGWERPEPSASAAGSSATEGPPNFSLFPQAVQSDGALVRVPANSNDPPAAPFDQLLVEELESFLKQPQGGRPTAVLMSLRMSWWKSQAVIHPSVASQPWTDDEKRHATAVMAIDSLAGHTMRLLEAAGSPQRTAVMLVGLPPRRKRNETNVFLKALPVADVSVTKGGKTTKLSPAPCVVRWPSQLSAGLTVQSACSFQDLMPTIADLVRSQRRPKSVQGISQLKSWRENKS